MKGAISESYSCLAISILETEEQPVGYYSCNCKDSTTSLMPSWWSSLLSSIPSFRNVKHDFDAFLCRPYKDSQQCCAMGRLTRDRKPENIEIAVWYHAGDDTTVE